MKSSLFAFCLVFSFAAGAHVPKQVAFQGPLLNQKSSGPECDSLFKGETFRLTHFRVGPSYLTSVLNIRGAKGDFLENVNLVGRLGYSQDFRVEKRGDVGNRKVDYFASGIVDERFLLAEFKIALRDTTSGTEVCSASAEFSGMALNVGSRREKASHASGETNE